MLSEEQYIERTPDLVAKIRKMREAAEWEMNRFTRPADYDVRRVVGQKPKPSPASDQTTPSPAEKRAKKPISKSATTQTSIQFSPAPAERGDKGESA
jgi:hypothetical protein